MARSEDSHLMLVAHATGWFDLRRAPLCGIYDQCGGSWTGAGKPLVGGGGHDISGAAGAESPLGGDAEAGAGFFTAGKRHLHGFMAPPLWRRRVAPTVPLLHQHSTLSKQQHRESVLFQGITLARSSLLLTRNLKNCFDAENSKVSTTKFDVHSALDHCTSPVEFESDSANSDVVPACRSYDIYSDVHNFPSWFIVDFHNFPSWFISGVSS